MLIVTNKTKQTKEKKECQKHIYMSTILVSGQLIVRLKITFVCLYLNSEVQIIFF